MVPIVDMPTEVLDTSSKEPTTPEASADTDSNQMDAVVPTNNLIEPDSSEKAARAGTEELNLEISTAPNAAQLSDQANKPLATAVSLTPAADNQGFRHPMGSQLAAGNPSNTHNFMEKIMSTKAKKHQATVYDLGRGVRRFYKNKTAEFVYHMERMHRSEGSSFGCPEDGPTYYDLDVLLEAFEEFIKADLASGSGIKFDGVRVID